MSKWKRVRLVVEIEVLEHFGTTHMCIDVVDRLKRSYYQHPDLLKGVRYKGITAKDYRRVRGAEKRAENRAVEEAMPEIQKKVAAYAMTHMIEQLKPLTETLHKLKDEL